MVCLFSSCFSNSHNSLSIILASFGEELAECWHKAALIRTMECLIKYPQAMAVCQHPVPVQAKKPPTFNNSMQPTSLPFNCWCHTHTQRKCALLCCPLYHSHILSSCNHILMQDTRLQVGILELRLHFQNVQSDKSPFPPLDPFALRCRVSLALKWRLAVQR